MAKMHLTNILLDRENNQCYLSWSSAIDGVEWKSYKLAIPDDHGIMLVNLPDAAAYGYILAKQCDEIEVPGPNTKVQ